MKKQPMLAPNECIDFDELTYPVLASPKLDGVRVIAYQGVAYSREWKPFGAAVQYRLRSILDLSRRLNLVLDGELYAHGIKFNELMSLIKPSAPSLTQRVQLHVFDCVPESEWGSCSTAFATRYEMYLGLQRFGLTDWQALIHSMNHTEIGLRDYFKAMLVLGYEGLMVRALLSPYKHGRATLNEGYIYKFKEWVTLDAQIIGFEQGTRMRESVRTGERERDEMGYLKRTSKQETREKVEEIGTVKVRTAEGMVCGVGFKKNSGLYELIKWANRNEFMGKWVEFEFMSHGAKDKPRFGRITRLRPDLDGEHVSSGQS
jgi:DNA ligase-1